eukprot:m.213839 g.213839  ORF g.213839 m.213839 type:complete len:685 (+) comp30098_c0_seq1:51-2105(+)
MAAALHERLLRLLPALSVSAEDVDILSWETISALCALLLPLIDHSSSGASLTLLLAERSKERAENKARLSREQQRLSEDAFRNVFAKRALRLLQDAAPGGPRLSAKDLLASWKREEVLGWFEHVVAVCESRSKAPAARPSGRSSDSGASSGNSSTRPSHDLASSRQSNRPSTSSLPPLQPSTAASFDDEGAELLLDEETAVSSRSEFSRPFTAQHRLLRRASQVSGPPADDKRSRPSVPATTRHDAAEKRGESVEFQTRRTDLLKAQSAHLQRQLLTMTDKLAQSHSAVVSAEVHVSALLDRLRPLLQQGRESKKAAVVLPIDDFASLLGNIETTLKQMTVAAAAGSGGSDAGHCRNSLDTALPAELMSPFLHRRDVTMLDTCTGKTDHINLKFVSQLESQLHHLYLEVTHSLDALRLVADLKPSATRSSTSVSTTATTAHPVAAKRIQSLLPLLAATSQSLLNVSVLLPVAPPNGSASRPIGASPCIPSCDDVMKVLPSSGKKRVEVRRILGKLLELVEKHARISDLRAAKADGDVRVFAKLLGAQLQLVEECCEAFEQEQENSLRELSRSLDRVFRVYDAFAAGHSQTNDADVVAALASEAQGIKQVLAEVSNSLPSSEGRGAWQGLHKKHHSMLEGLKTAHKAERDVLLQDFRELQDEVENLARQFMNLPLQAASSQKTVV